MSKSVKVSSQSAAESQKNAKKDVQYEDELDEDFEEKLAENSTPEELQNTLNSFENPKGLEESPDSDLLNGPQMDKKQLEDLMKKLTKKQRAALAQMVASVSKNTNFGLGTKENLSKVSGDHRTDSAARLRQLIAEKRNSRKTKSTKLFEADRQKTANTELHRKDGQDGEIVDPEIENLDEPHDHAHTHTSSCSHGVKSAQTKRSDVKVKRVPDQPSGTNKSEPPIVVVSPHRQATNNQSSTHVHSASCNHEKEHADELVKETATPGKNAKRNKKRREAAKAKPSDVVSGSDGTSDITA